MSTDRSAALADFSRSCKAAARAVSLYPGTHPAIQSALARVTAAGGRLTDQGDVTLGVLPDGLAIDGGGTPSIDPPTAELAALLHERLVGELRLHPGAGAEDWRALLLVLTRPADELRAAGGIAGAWTAAGRSCFEIREIDYAEVLRERGGTTAEWDRIIASCLKGDPAAADERALEALFDVPGDPTRVAALLDRFEHGPASDGAMMTARATALLGLVRAIVAAALRRGVDREQALQTIADASARLTAGMVAALLSHRHSPDPDMAGLAAGVVDRMGDAVIASLVAGSIAAEGAATERLAYAFQALIPDESRRGPLLELARDEASRGALGADAGFEALWQNAARMLTSYSDAPYVPDDYGRELSGARAQAIDVDRVAGDSPERLQAWLATISATAIEQLDLDLLLDLARIETDPGQWREIAGIVVSEIERRMAGGDVDGAHRLTGALVHDAGPEGRPELATAARQALDGLDAGALAGHVVGVLRRTDDPGGERVAAFCRLAGPRLARPLAEALAVEQHPRAIRHLREVVLSFGAAGRQSVEQLKSSSNPVVRRTAIDLLRVFGGSEALPELASMLDDADPQVQRESIRAIVQIATPEAHAILERALVAGAASRDHLLQHLIGLRDDKAIPLLCYVLDHTRPRRRLAAVHAEILEALGGLGNHPEATRALRTALHRGAWWAPRRTAALREAAAAALRRIGSAETRAVLEDAAARGGRGVRQAIEASAGAGRERRS